MDSMTNILARSDEDYPVRASVLARLKDEGINREAVIKAIKERRVVFHDIDDVIALYIAGLLTKDDVKRLLESFIYVPRGIEELVKLVEVGILSREEAKRISEELRRRFEFRIFGLIH